MDFGLDAVTCNRRGNKNFIYFSTKILYGDSRNFTDGDILRINDGVILQNKDLIKPFHPKTDFMGVDAVSILMKR